jgi:phosphoribosylformylglycinamidine synthase
MIAGGVGTVRPANALKDRSIVKSGAHVVVFGGPAMLVGLGGGATSSLASGENAADLDFASVQRGNPEMQRRAQMVIDACAAQGAQNPIQLIHDVGAGGLCNALPELVHDAGLGASFELRDIDSADRGLSPLQIWCCEAQERYVAIVSEDGLKEFQRIAKRERCGYSIVGRAVADPEGENRLILTDRESAEFPRPVDIPMSVLFGQPPRMSRVVDSRRFIFPRFDSSLTTYTPQTPTDGLLNEAVSRVLTLPAVGSKSFLITIGDRTVGGLVVRDQMVGPWQVPVADVSVTATSLMLGVTSGEAMAMGERPSSALISPAASARMAVAEALTNLAAADVTEKLSRVRLSANWMAASSHPGEGAALYEAVEAVAMDLCPELGISIPVGKDSMSMKMAWTDPNSKEPVQVTAPLSLVVSAFAPVERISRTWTPALRRLEDVGESILLFVDLAEGMRALGGSALAQVFGQVGDEAPDVRSAQLLKDYFDAVQQLHELGIVLAYHDRSDGGLFTTLVEMMFAGRCGIDVMLENLCSGNTIPELIETLFNEELGGVFQVRKQDEADFRRCFATCGPPPGLIKRIGRVPRQKDLTLRFGLTVVYRESRAWLQQRWSHTSYVMQRLRDNPACADAEYAAILNDDDPGLRYLLKFKPKENILPLKATLPSLIMRKPRVAVLREQGVNGHAEMAFAFHQAGFVAVDVHMTDILGGQSLAGFTGLAACGGFSYGDVLGAGRGWATSVLLHDKARREFGAFFARPDTFTLGVCNGAQFLARLRELIPGTADWPVFERNESEQYEARLCMVEVVDGRAASVDTAASSLPPCVFFHGMNGSMLPVAVAHAEGRAVFDAQVPLKSGVSEGHSGNHQQPLPLQQQQPQAQMQLREPQTQPPPRACVALRFVDNASLRPTHAYPFNPSGSPDGIAGVRSADGRVLAMMPHPERTVLRDTVSWAPPSDASGSGEAQWGDVGPWARLFQSARRWVN